MSEDSLEVMGAEGKGGLGCIGPAAGGGEEDGEREESIGEGEGEGVRAEWGVMGLGSGGGFLFGTK